MINRALAPHTVWGGTCDSWTLTDRDGLHVMQEEMPPGTAERSHLHRDVRQLYFVLAGQATVRFGDREETLSPRDAVEVAPGEPHQLRNDSSETLEFLVVSTSAPRKDRIDLEPLHPAPR